MCGEGWEKRGWGDKIGADAWVTVNCAYLVVIVISVTRPDVLLSCEAAVGEHISYISSPLSSIFSLSFTFSSC